MHDPRFPVKARCCVSVCVDVEGPVVTVLKALLYSCNLQKGKKEPGPSNETLTANMMYKAFKNNKTRISPQVEKRENVLTTKVHKLTP